MANSAEHLLACEVQLHRSANFFRGNGGQHRVRPDKPLTAEPSANERGDDMNFFLGHAQDLGDRVAGANHPLGSFVEGQLVT